MDTLIKAWATERTHTRPLAEQERKQSVVYRECDLDGEVIATLVEELLEKERETLAGSDSGRLTKPALEGERHRILNQAIVAHQWLARWICFLDEHGAPELEGQADAFRSQLKRLEGAMGGALPMLRKAVEGALVQVVRRWLAHGRTQTVEVSELLSQVAGRPIFISVVHQQELRVRAGRDREKQQNRSHLRLAKRMVKRALA